MIHSKISRGILQIKKDIKKIATNKKRIIKKSSFLFIYKLKLPLSIQKNNIQNKIFFPVEARCEFTKLCICFSNKEYSVDNKYEIGAI